ncbi:MAG: addiction module protein [Gemmataceae bacterium]
MSATVDQLKSQAVTLTSAERAELAHFLLKSMEPRDEGVEAAWKIEITRRVADIRNGTAKGRPADEVLAELRERYP